MTTIAFRSPVTKPLKRHDEPPFIWTREWFRVTQRFGDPDFYWRDIDPARAALGHRATDIGDYGCGSPIVAMAGGTAWRIQDNAASLPNVPPGTTNALGVAIDHGHGVMTQYWHLGGWMIPIGRTVITAGQVIGFVGSTGLGAVCHCHITMTLNGQLIDPEPHMFGQPLIIGATAGGDMALDKAAVAGLHGLDLIAKGTNIREAPSTAARIIASVTTGIPLIATAVVIGQFVSLGDASGDRWFAVWVEEHNQTKIGFVHDSTVTLAPKPVTTAPPVDCSPAVSAERGRWKAWLLDAPE